MSAENQSKNENKESSWWLRQAPVTIAGILFLALAASTLYDLLVRPGLTRVGHFFLTVLTLGSSALRDLAYASAALDPNPITPLILLQIVVAVAGFPAIWLVLKVRYTRDKERVRRTLDQLQVEERLSELEREITQSKRKLRYAKLLFWIIFVPWWGAIFLAYSVHNQSVLIWRAFHANLTIVAPFITVDQEEKLAAQFASMNSSNDYDEIKERLNGIAKVHNLQLRDLQTW